MREGQVVVTLHTLSLADNRANSKGLCAGPKGTVSIIIIIRIFQSGATTKYLC